MLVSEALTASPCHCKDLGGQIGAIITDPGTRPREYLTNVSVVELGEGVRVV